MPRSRGNMMTTWLSISFPPASTLASGRLSALGEDDPRHLQTIVILKANCRQDKRTCLPDNPNKIPGKTVIGLAGSCDHSWAKTWGSCKENMWGKTSSGQKMEPPRTSMWTKEICKGRVVREWNQIMWQTPRKENFNMAWTSLSNAPEVHFIKIKNCNVFIRLVKYWTLTTILWWGLGAGS